MDYVTVSRIAEILANEPAKVDFNIKGFMKTLEVPLKRYNFYSSGTVDYVEFIRDIIQEWVSREGPNATIGKIADALKCASFTTASDLISQLGSSSERIFLDSEQKIISKQASMKDEKASKMHAINMTELYKCGRMTEQKLNVTEVAKILAEDVYAVEKWETLAYEMNLDQRKLLQLRMQFMLGNVNYYAIFITILKEWQSTQGPENATVSNLRHTLNKAGFRYLSERLEQF